MLHRGAADGVDGLQIGDSSLEVLGDIPRLPTMPLVYTTPLVTPSCVIWWLLQLVEWSSSCTPAWCREPARTSARCARGSGASARRPTNGCTSRLNGVRGRSELRPPCCQHNCCSPFSDDTTANKHSADSLREEFVVSLVFRTPYYNQA